MNITEFAMFKKMVGKGGGGESYSLCMVSIFDQDCCGPFNVTYKAYENGSLVDKQATVPAGETIEIVAIAGKEIFIHDGYFSIAQVCRSNGDYDETIDKVRYADRGAYVTVPDLGSCFIIIYG